MTGILIIGAGGHAQVIADLMKCRRQAGADISLVGFLDDNVRLLGSYNPFGKVLDTVIGIGGIPHDSVLIGIGDNQVRHALYRQLEEWGERLVALVHPSAVVASDVHIGAGSVVFAGAVINTGTVIGNNVIINTGATVDHHNIIESHAHIGPGSHLAGGVVVGEGAFLGVGVSVLPNREIGAWSVIGAGAVVIDDILPHVTAIGVPAKIRSSQSTMAESLTGG